MIVFAAIVPHSPLLLPTIGKEHREKLAKTLASVQEIEQALYLAKPDVLCIISPHGVRYPDAFSINLASKYVGSLKAFGDFSTTVEAKSDYLSIDRLQRKLRVEGVPFTLTSSEDIDYGFAVPLLLLTTHLTAWKLIPVSPSMLGGKEHYDFGRQLKRVLHAEEDRVAVIASADLSHKLGPESPAGPSEQGPAFDRAVQDAIAKNDPKPLLALDASVTEESAQCGYRPIMTLLGSLENMSVTPKLLSYEAPFGVGYLTARYDIS
ncbi:AmmeMemoRadiSam system protein B [Patescibacteria group bacterium]|nr:AmmeMemoRadiSam system protein B [Patescibacteria group bacterium]MBU1448420.1 AmmeMemoRadiSam system protein B [Patescibacteria group bacterium]MBU2613488.1 AmmeMemoRadiSam system protein B [Patescibacteria group bacterium]